MLSVSIVAGPAAPTLITKARAKREPRCRIFEPTSRSNPGQIIEHIKTVANEGETDHLVIQCEVDRPIMAYASLFADPSGPLASLCQLTTVAFAIEASMLLDLLLNQKATPASPCLLAEQVEFVTGIFLVGPANNSDLVRARTIAQTLNPYARIGPVTESALTARHNAAPSFDFRKALESAGWRKLIDEEISAIPSAGEVAAFGYRARRPFQPERLWTLLQTGLPGLFRAKGFFWLASRMDEVGGLNLAGAEIQCASAGRWWAARDADIRDSEMPARTRKEWQEPFGDRRQSFAVIALGVDRDTLQQQLNSCLLTDQEMAGGPDSWRSFADPFPSWAGHARTHEHDHDCDHDHGSHGHDCCGH
jgi:G3E family GTPase